MKRIILYITISLFVVGPLCAQNTKFGHVSPEAIMEQMPGFDTAQNAMQAFQNELQSDGQMMVKEFQKKQQEYQDKSATYSASVKKIKEDELASMYQRIQNFSDSMEEKLEQKKYELLLPFQTKILDAIKIVAKEGGYTYIFNKSILSYSAKGDDISEKVKAKLGI
ncbi:OmpH family outer membrane protein [Bacteroidales bacterium OttesenSCG-928-C03]|nr:OmpH family outer membrane protein [Bacteroidales bacterium OttesenSCG-928-E04]MDL2309247.1 OmpH family outer membrane protein [Bacteroidales bacterium OttesenSCG-928-C03]MDL2326869.1 OmpH family outer membrane protein [Bacteroidales bacterium OttesenSCG-928-A14]